MAAIKIERGAFYKVSDAAEVLGLSDYTVRRWIRDGRLKAHKVGVRYFIKGAEISAALSGDQRQQHEGKT